MQKIQVNGDNNGITQAFTKMGNSVKAGVDSMMTKFGGVGSKVGNSLSGISSGFRGATAAMGGLGAAGAVAGGTIAAALTVASASIAHYNEKIQKGIEATAEYETLYLRMKSSLDGDKYQTDSRMNELNSFAASTLLLVNSMADRSGSNLVRTDFASPKATN